jgi:Flp pilus assembly protein TadG
VAEALIPSTGERAQRSRRERGAALIEFAIILPLLCALIFGIIDFGFMVNRDTLINNAAREGAREGTLNPVEADIRAVVLSSLGSLDPSDITVTITCRRASGTACAGSFDAQAESGGVVIVDVSYAYTWITPVPALFGISSNTSLQKTVEMRIE